MLRCLTLLILLMVVIAGVLAYLVLGAPPAVAPTVQATSTPSAARPATSPPAALSAEQAAANFDQKIGTFEKAIATPGKKPVELVLTQQEVTAKVSQLLAAKASGELQNLAVQLQEGGAIISANTSVAGMNVPVQATADLSASGGMLGVNVTSVKTGGLDLPKSVTDQLLLRIQQAMGLNNLQKIDVGIDVQTVQVTPTQVKISGQTR